MKKQKKIARLHYITQDVDGLSHAQLAFDACTGGVRWVQLRVKNKQFNEWLFIAKKVQRECKKFGALFIINDNVEIAKAINADGVHLGKDDMSPIEARKILGEDAIIGGSTNSIEDIHWMNECGVDYIGIGPFRHTTTKENLNPILGLEKISTMAALSKVSAVAIGGITKEDVKSIFDAGVYGVAVSSFINRAEDRVRSASGLLEEINIAAESGILKIKE